MFQTEHLDHIALTVHDLGRSADWYQNTLCLEVRGHYRDTTGRGRPVVLGSGSGNVALFPAAEEHTPTPLQGHIAFKLNRANFDQAQTHLRQLGITFDYVEYKTCHSIYFSDPDGYQIELSTWEL